MKICDKRVYPDGHAECATHGLSWRYGTGQYKLCPEGRKQYERPRCVTRIEPIRPRLVVDNTCGD